MLSFVILPVSCTGGSLFTIVTVGCVNEDAESWGVSVSARGGKVEI